MYSENFDHKSMDRIHTTDKTAANTKSWVPEAILMGRAPETANKDTSLGM